MLIRVVGQLISLCGQLQHFDYFAVSLYDQFIDLFIGDIGVEIQQLEGYYISAITLIRIVMVGYGVAQHYFDIFLWILEGLELSDEDGAVFVLFADIVDGLSRVDCLT